MPINSPAGSRLEEVVFNLAALATHTGPIIDTLDWYGSELGDNSDARVFGWPLLDLAVLAPGNININLQYATNTTPGAAPTLAWTSLGAPFPVAVAGGAWGVLTAQRIEARFARYQIVDTSAAPNNGIYVVSFMRAQ